MQLLNNYLLVREAKKKDEGAFTTASALNDLLGRGEVVNIPDDNEGGFPPIGATVYFEKNIGNEFELEGQKVKFVKLEDVMGFE